MMSKIRRAASLLLFAACFVDHVVCKRIGGSSGKKPKGGDNLGDAVNSLGLSPELTAALAITIIVAIFTFLQFVRAAQRFKKPTLPIGAPTLPYNVGKPFLWLLTSYLLFYLLYNIFFAILIGQGYGPTFITSGLGVGMAFLGQVADVLFLGMVLEIVTYRQRLQFNPAEKRFNLKSFLDGWLLSVMLILGIAEDGLVGSLISGRSVGINIFNDVRNFGIAYEAFNFVASLDVVFTAIMVHNRLKKSGIQDIIVRKAAIWVSIFILIRALYRIIAVALTNAAPSMGFRIDRAAFLITGVAVGGACSLAVAGICLTMGAPPRPPKDKKKKNVTPEPVKA